MTEAEVWIWAFCAFAVVLALVFAALFVSGLMESRDG